MIDWADRWFRYLVAGEKDARPPKRYGLEFAKQELKGFLRHALSFLIGGALLLGMINFINDPGRSAGRDFSDLGIGAWLRWSRHDLRVRLAEAAETKTGPDMNRQNVPN